LKLGYRSVSDLTPAEIAIEVSLRISLFLFRCVHWSSYVLWKLNCVIHHQAFEQVQSYLEKEDGMARPDGL